MIVIKEDCTCRNHKEVNMSFQDKQNINLLKMSLHQKESSKPSKHLFSEDDVHLNINDQAGVKSSVNEAIPINGFRKQQKHAERCRSFTSISGGALGKVNGLILNMHQRAQMAVDENLNRKLAQESEQEKLEKVIKFVDQAASNTHFGSDNQMNHVTEAIGIIEKVIQERSAYRNRVESLQQKSLQGNLNKLLVAAENLTAAESTVRDLKVAKKMVAFTRSQCLIHAAQSSTSQMGMRGFLELV